MSVLAVLALMLSVVAVHDVLRRPTIRRVALRNVTRRVGEASLVVFGSALGTAIIAGAFIVGDTFDKSIRDIARTDFGPIDQIVTFTDLDDLDAGLMAFNGSDPIARVDGVAPVVQIRAAVASTAVDRRAEPNASVTTADFDVLRALGEQSSGLADAGATPVGSEAIVDAEIAAELGVDVGDAIEVFAYGTSLAFEVRQIVPQIGIAGFGEVFVEPGTLESIATSGDAVAAPPRGRLLISNEGDVFDSTENIGPILQETGQRLDAAGLSYDQADVKADLLEDAEAEGSEITEVFTAVGGFSVLAGVLLLVNLFVMLAEERKRSLGVLRAVGWRRGHLVRSFVLEGAAYGLLAAAVGALLGIPVGWVIIQATQRIFADGDVGLDLRLAIEPKSLLTAGLVGLVISLSVSWLTSWRISRLNIIRAIRDLPEPGTGRARKFTLVLGVLGVVLGAFVTIVPGLGGESAALLLAGVPLALFSSLPLLSRIDPSRRPWVLVGLAVIAWSIAVFSLFADIMEDPPIAVFLIQGVLLVAGSVAITSSLGPWWARVASRVPRGAEPSTQLGLAYPVARRFRTGVSLSMFSLIVFSLTFIAVLSSAFNQQTAAFAEEASSGYDALVLSNAANPITADELLASGEVARSSTVLRGFPQFSAPFDPATVSTPEDWPISGIDSSFVALDTAPELTDRDPRFADDVAVFEAVLSDPTLVVVASWFLGDDDGTEPIVGDIVTVINNDGETRDLTVAGIMENDWIFGGAFVSSELVRTFLPGEFAASQHYVEFAGGVDPELGADAITGQFVENGADAETFDAIVGNEVDQQRGFFNLLSGYLSLGLLIGVAGLGVVMIRAVRERRSQVGMLRAMGMPTTGIRSMFLTEGAFVAFQGVASGILLGLLSSYQLLVRSNTFEIQLDFVIPWLSLAIIAFLPLAASALASAIPARRAAKLPAAAALRLAD